MYVFLSFDTIGNKNLELILVKTKLDTHFYANLKCKIWKLKI